MTRQNCKLSIGMRLVYILLLFARQFSYRRYFNQGGRFRQHIAFSAMHSIPIKSISPFQFDVKIFEVSNSSMDTRRVHSWLCAIFFPGTSHKSPLPSIYSIFTSSKSDFRRTHFSNPILSARICISFTLTCTLALFSA